MKLKTFIEQNGMTFIATAKMLGCTRQSLHRYANGERIPDIKRMKAIYVLTGGKVDANAFYGLSPDLLAQPNRPE